jgi:hypothetical protein
MPVVEALWEHNLGRWTSIADMSGYAVRRKALDRFWRHKVGLEASPSQSRTVVVFGDGKFPPTGRRERAVPRKAMEAAAARFAMMVVKVREAYTAKVCSSCHEPTKEVQMRLWKKTRKGVRRMCRVEVPELRRCESSALFRNSSQVEGHRRRYQHPTDLPCRERQAAWLHEGGLRRCDMFKGVSVVNLCSRSWT